MNSVLRSPVKHQMLVNDQQGQWDSRIAQRTGNFISSSHLWEAKDCINLWLCVHVFWWNSCSTKCGFKNSIWDYALIQKNEIDDICINMHLLLLTLSKINLPHRLLWGENVKERENNFSMRLQLRVVVPAKPLDAIHFYIKKKKIREKLNMLY